MLQQIANRKFYATNLIVAIVMTLDAFEDHFPVAASANFFRKYILHRLTRFHAVPLQ